MYGRLIPLESLLQGSMYDVTVGYCLLSDTSGPTACSRKPSWSGYVLSGLLLSFSVKKRGSDEHQDIVTRRQSVFCLVISVTYPVVVYELLYPELGLFNSSVCRKTHTIWSR